MAQKHNADYAEKPMTRDGKIQGPSRRYRRLRNPIFPASEWTNKNPLLQRGEFGIELDTHRVKAGDGYTLWNDLPYISDVIAEWGAIGGDIDDQTDLINMVDGKVAAEATARENADITLQNNIDGVANNLADEITNRQDADNGLQSQITDNKNTMDGHIADTNNPHNVTKSQVGLGNCDNTSDLDKPISTATQNALDGKVDKNAAITGATKCKITYDSKGLVTAGADLTESDIPALHLSKITDVTASAAEVNVLDGITASTTELNYTDGVTGPIQTQLDSKVTANAAITGATHTKITYDNKGLVTGGTDITLADVTDITASAAEVNVLDGITASTAELNILDGVTATTTELNYVDGVTSPIQTQISNNKTAIDNHIANTSNPHSVTKAQVGLGNVDNTADLDKPISTATQAALDGKQNVSTANYQMGNASGGWNTMTSGQQDALNSGATTTNIGQIATNTSTIAGHIADTNNPHSVTKTQVGLGNVDNTSDLNKPISTATQTALDGKQAKSASAYNMGNASGGWTAMSTAQQNALNSGATTTNIGQIATNTNNIANEIIDRQNADNGLQNQIDAIVSKSDVVDIVGTYAELQAYDTSTLGNNDVVKVLDDSTHNDAQSYYRWVITGGVGAWVYIGSEAETYTKAETDALLNNKQDTITDLATIRAGAALGATALQPGDNVSELVNDAGYLTQHQTLADLGITATASEINVLDGITASTAELNYTDGVTSNIQTQLNGKQATISDLATIRSGAALGATAVQPGDLATVATSGDYDDLTNKPTIPTVNNATLTIQKNGTTVNTFTANASSNVTANITVPTTAADVGAVAANTAITGATKCKITYDSKGLVTAGANLQASDIPSLTLSKISDVTASAAEVNILDGITATTAELNYTDGVTSNIQTQLNAKQGLLGGGTSGTVLTNSGTAGTVTATTLATVATSGSYTDLSNKPTIPTVNDATITITQGGVTKGSFTLNQATGDTIALDAGGGSSYTAGNGISIDANNEISVTAPTLVNTATGTDSLTIGGTAAAQQDVLNIGINSLAYRGSVALGKGASSQKRGIAIGVNANANGTTVTACPIVIGYKSTTTADFAIQLGSQGSIGATNSDANTFKVANANGNFEIMSADGTIPEARLADTTNAQQGDVLTLDSTGNAVWQAGGGGSSLDAGFMCAFAGSTAPAGWLVCDGSAVSRTTYSDLFDAIGTTYGAGDGSTTFNLPDLSGKMPLYDSAATLGNTTAGKVPNITGGFYVDGNNGPSNFSGAFSAGSGIYSYRNSNSGHATIATIQFNANTVSAVYDNDATSVTPAGVYTLWCIKY